jgi:hypothetical protein
MVQTEMLTKLNNFLKEEIKELEESSEKLIIKRKKLDKKVNDAKEIILNLLAEYAK